MQNAITYGFSTLVLEWQLKELHLHHELLLRQINGGWGVAQGGSGWTWTRVRMDVDWGASPQEEEEEEHTHTHTDIYNEKKNQYISRVPFTAVSHCCEQRD